MCQPDSAHQSVAYFAGTPYLFRQTLEFIKPDGQIAKSFVERFRYSELPQAIEEKPFRYTRILPDILPINSELIAPFQPFPDEKW